MHKHRKELHAMKKQRKLSNAERQQIEARLRTDIRVKELYETLKERPLNVLEQIMLDQILKEYGYTCRKKSTILKDCKVKFPNVVVNNEFKGNKVLPQKKERTIIGAFLAR